jgi:hypothetical protein
MDRCQSIPGDPPTAANFATLYEVNCEPLKISELDDGSFETCADRRRTSFRWGPLRARAFAELRRREPLVRGRPLLRVAETKQVVQIAA